MLNKIFHKQNSGRPAKLRVRPGFLKLSVGASLSVFGVFIVIILVGGLIIPKSVLLKLSNVEADDAGALVGSSLQDDDDLQEDELSTEENGGSDTSTPEQKGSQDQTGSSATTPATPGPSTGGGNTGGISPVAPVLSLVASPTVITSGSNTVISWSISAGATQPVNCTAGNAWSGAKATSGSENKSPTLTSTFSMTCSNSAGESTKSVSVTVNPPAPACGSGGSCTTTNVSPHTSAADCWVIVSYSASGGNGTGKVYKISSGFFGGSGSHTALPGAPSLSAGSWCGKNISSTFNSKHSGGSRSDGTNTAIWWLTNNGNSLIGDWTGN